MYNVIPPEIMLEQLIQLEEAGLPIDEALDLLAWQEEVGVPTVDVTPSNRKYAIHQWVQQGEGLGRQLSKHPVEEGFASYEEAVGYLMSEYGGEDNSITWKIVRYN